MHRLLLLFFLLFAANTASAVSVIRDAEIEAVIWRISSPVLKAAGPQAKHVHLHLLGDLTINAFTAGGDDIIIYSGMILSCESPAMVRGVIAHELAHVMHHHVAKKINYIREAQSNILASVIIGAGAVLAGSPEGGIAAIMGGMHISERQMLKHSRAHEQQADQTGIEYLHKSKFSAIGMLELQKKLEQNNRSNFKLDNSYQLTHPLSSERISYVRTAVDRERGFVDEDPNLLKSYNRMRGKLISYLLTPTQMEKQKPRLCRPTQQTDDCYNNAIMLLRQHKLQDALISADILLKKEPANPYFHELRGQILFEQGNYQSSINSYHQATKLLPSNALLRTELANVLIEKGDQTAINQAITELIQANKLALHDSGTLYLLGIAYGKAKQIGESFYYLAEAAIEQGNYPDAKRYAKEATNHLSTNSPLYRKNQDILAVAVE